LSDREASTSSKHSRNTAHSQSSSSSHHPMALLPRTRAVVSILILVAAVAIGTTAYVLTARSQNQAFETQVRVNCAKSTATWLLCRRLTLSYEYTLNYSTTAFAT
jgi:hypothetical protein